MKRVFFLMIALAALTFAQDEVPDSYFRLKTKKIEDTATKSFKEKSIEFKRTLEYPVSSVLNARIKEIVDRFNKEQIDEFKKNSSKDLIAEVTEKDLYSSASWYEYATHNLYNVIDDFVVLSSTLESYTGGAHGSYYTGYTNYKDGKELEIKDIYGNNIEGFYKVAEKLYKESAGLLPSQSLEADGWFEDKFVLAESFALRDDGILFLYNIYEIKPYADGQTAYILPYYRLKGVLDKSSAIYSLIKNSQAPTNYEKIIDFGDKGSLKLNINKEPNGAKIEYELGLNSDYKEVWLSFSFPQIKDKNSVKVLTNEKGIDTEIYPKGSKIYNKKLTKNIEAKYLLVEASLKNYICYESDFSGSFFVKRGDFDSLYLNIRVSGKTKDGKVVETIDKESANFFDQQDFLVNRVVVDISD